MRGSRVAVVLGTLVILVACSSTTTGLPECRTDTDCESTDAGRGLPACKRAECHGGVCEVGIIADGSEPTRQVTNQPCHRDICDGAGGTKLVVDLSRVPFSSERCKKGVCNPDATPSFVPDETKVGTIIDLPKGDCKKTKCEADGSETDIPDNSDAPKPTGTCQGGACNNGQPVTGASPPGTPCLSYGAVCNATGQCTDCPAPDAACIDNGPAKNATTVTSAVDFGETTTCDETGELGCVLLNGQTQRRYFKLTYKVGSLFCEYDPSFKFLASKNIRFCAFFNSPSFNCPVGTPTPDSGFNGCCVDGTVGELGAPNKDSWRQAVLSVEALTQECTSVSVSFHL